MGHEKIGQVIRPATAEEATDEQSGEIAVIETQREGGVERLVKTIRRVIMGDERPLYQRHIHFSFPSAEDTFPFPIKPSSIEEEMLQSVVKEED